MNPFECTKHITLRDNKIFLQVKITSNNPNKVFPTGFNFLLLNPDAYDLQDLNENLFLKSGVFNTDEIRSFVYIITPK